MAKCDLSIELDDPGALHDGGGMISGVVRVQADADVKCKGLTVKSGWKTHGRGNVAKATAGSQTLFQGQWTEGQQCEYRFELPVAHWPPTYHGFHLNVDHAIEARADIPWSFDPKASVNFIVHPTRGDEAMGKPKTRAVSNVVGTVIVGIAALGFFAGMAGCLAGGLQAFGPFALLFLLVPLAIGGLVFAKYVLPKWVLGEVQLTLGPEQLHPGQSLEGELSIRPRKTVAINGVTVHLTATERCVSGSGSNRRTHKHVLYEQTEVLAEAGAFNAGQVHRFPISVALPADAPFSIDLSDNDLIWDCQVRVDIPRWPDWVKKQPLQVVPSGTSGAAANASTMAGGKGGGPLPAPAGSERANGGPDADESSDGITFAETAQHLWAVRGDREQVDLLVDAVNGMKFNIDVTIERRLLYAGAEDPHVYRDGFAVWANCRQPALPLVLYVPHHLGDEFEQSRGDGWQGIGTIVGWDHRHGRLQIKL
ncbi:hypothetical protein K227x_08010 [Rubripirellula lacrimiformis]|uniref:Arrestin-like N-terminal domain-containing protein n=1 Tax=Rubripirellula lacrimiformis TaxID=1930273 RepID=A0A517N5M0_9BACT|nr:sporulation protein [Rubripirellula lacrimiformis]QDT02425.1 hypothetical protein K227x_08010 [Rubripirellula lacrimiformis]